LISDEVIDKNKLALFMAHGVMHRGLRYCSRRMHYKSMYDMI